MMRIIIFIACVLFFFSSCNKNCYRDITEEEKSRLAYKGGEVIIFKSSVGDVDTMKLDQNVTTFYHVKEKKCKSEKQEFGIAGLFSRRIFSNAYLVSFSTLISSPEYKSKDFLYPEIATSFGYFVLNKSTPITSLNVNGHQLNNVYELVNLQPVDDPKVDRLYFTFQYGLVRINLANGDYWERQNF